MAKSKSTKELSSGCLSLFGLPFFAAGLFLSGLYFHGYFEWWRVSRWVETPCWIESAELKESQGDDSTSYQAKASYRYEYDGRVHHGERVALNGGSDNLGAFQHDAYRELTRHVVTKGKGAEREPGDPAKAFRCYVNPADPTEAILYRTLRWEKQAFMAVFALTFPAVGAALVFGGLIHSARSKRENQRRLQHPEEPWKWKAAWTGTAIPETWSPWLAGLHLYTIWAGLVIVPLLITTAQSGAFQSQGTAWLVWIFAAVWSVPLWFSLKRLRQHLSIGRARFEMPETPASPGGLLRGFIVLDKAPPARLATVVRLSCEKSSTRPSGDGDSTSTEAIWSHTADVPPETVTHDVSGFRIPVSITLPADAPPSGGTDQPSVKHDWKLQLKVQGSVIRSTFEVPVFPSTATPVALAQPGGLSIHDQAAADLPTLLAGSGLRVEFDSTGTPASIVCPPARHKLLIVFLILFNLIWSAAAVFLITQHAPLLFRLVWTVSAAVIWLSIIWQIFHKRSALVTPQGLEIRNQFGPLIRTRRMEKHEITGFSHDSNMSSNTTPYYRVRLESVLGKKHTLADGIIGEAAAAELMKRMDDWRKRPV